MDTLNLTHKVEMRKPSRGLQSHGKTLCLVSVFVTLFVGAVCLGLVLHRVKNHKIIARCGTADLDTDWRLCHDSSYYAHCNVTMIESIPEKITYPEGSPSHPSIFNGWLRLLDAAQTSIYIASSYWSLRPDDVPVKDNSSWQGELIFNKLVAAGKRGVEIRIVHQVSSKQQPNTDTEILENMGIAQVRSLDLKRLIGAGILHTKMWLVDNMHFYVGSANMDWRSLTQVKELGLLTTNCSCLATDMSKIFDIYWMLAKPTSKIPETWPDKLDTDFNKDSPMQLTINGNDGNVYLSSSPPQLCTVGRTVDIDSILDVIHKAKKFIHIAVMDYSPTFLYVRPEKYWAVIDDALRAAAFDREVEVRFMASDWQHTKSAMIPFLKSLAILNDISHVNVEVRLFKVPKIEAQIPYSRVQHTKYMVTDNAAYVGTSNWSADYFTNTAGIGYIINQTLPENNESHDSDTIQQQLEDVFNRDWNSRYTKSIWEY